ncbi:amidohydrolase [Isosphaeraceae bacterium EP7]
MTRTLLASCLLAIIAVEARGQDPWFDGKIDGLVTLYRDLHAHPELSYQEVETAKRIAGELSGLGAEVTPNVGKLGVVGILKNGNGPVVLVRSDMDALPVAEATGLPYASKATGKNDAGQAVPVMHACGHDIHMTCLVGTARWLVDHKDRWSGTVILIGQPAEEAIGGAKAMLEDGLYTRFPRPDFALALHVAHDLETGKIGYISGPAMAGSTSLDVVVRGKGGHGAMPDKTVDPIVLASLLVLDMQTIVSREISPIQPAVVTVGSIHGGTRHNIIPDEVRLQLTIRAFRDDIRDLLLSGIRRRAEALAQGHKAPAPSVTVAYGTAPTINTPDLVSKVVPALKRAIGEANLVNVDPTMGAEDFGLYGRDGVPTFMFRLGTIPAARVAEFKASDKPLPSLHSALFAPDPAPSIRTGIAAMTSAVVELLPPKR